MAAWQFSFSLVPQRLLINQFGAMPSAITMEEFDAVLWWSECDPTRLEHLLDDVLPRGNSWSTNVLLWGTYEGHRLELVRDDSGTYAELSGRIDVRQADSRFLRAIVRLASSLDAVFIGEDRQVIAPTMVAVADAIARSRAAAYVRNPRAYFAGLASDHAEGDGERAT